MIDATLIRDILENELALRGLFLVEIAVRPGNRIAIYVDSLKGVTLEECIGVSRFVESKLDREAEDFELEVSSPGLDKPLKLPVQFEKNAGRMLDVVKSDGVKIIGKLLGNTHEMIRLESEVTIKDGKKGKKRKEMHIHEIMMNEIKAAKIIISLKK